MEVGFVKLKGLEKERRIPEHSDGILDFRPAKGRIILLLCAGLGAAVLLLCAGLIYELRFAKPLDARGYQVGAPEGLRYEVDYTVESGILTVRGWAVVEGQRLYVVNDRIALYNAGEGTYTELPSMMEPSDRAVEVLGEKPGSNYFTGVMSIVPISRLQGTLARYEICFVYENDYDNHYLVHTGVMLGDADG